MLCAVYIKSFKEVSGGLLEPAFAKNLRRIGVPFSVE
jgi:hypothetical protein